MLMGKLEEITQKQMLPLSTCLPSPLGGGENMDWVGEENGFGRQSHPGFVGIYMAT